MGTSSGRIQDPEKKTNSSLSHESDFSLSATSFDLHTNPCELTRGGSSRIVYASEHDSDLESSKSEVEEEQDIDYGHKPPLPPFSSRRRRCLTPKMLVSQHQDFLPCRCAGGSIERSESVTVEDDRIPMVSHPPSRMSLRVYNNGPLPCHSGVAHDGRHSPNHDLGYHTLVSREPPSSPSPTKQFLDVLNFGPWDTSQQVTSPLPQHPRPVGSCKPRWHSPTAGDAGLTRGKRLPKMSPFDRLSDDIVLKIFSYLATNQLCTCSRVCRRWYFLTWEPQLWTTIELMGERTAVDRALRTVVQLLCRDSSSVCLTVEKVVLNGCVRLTDRGIFTIARHCPELRRLELKGCVEVTNAGLVELVSSCANLEHLDVTGCTQITCINMAPGKVPLLAEVDCAIAPTRQLYIQYLDMTDCHSLTDVGLKVIVRNCPQLNQLFLRRCVVVTDVGIKYIASYCLLLRELSVSDCVQVTDFGMYELAKLGSILRYLSVAKCDQISDAGIKQIARHCYKLRYLNVRGCEAVSDDSLVMLARSCPRLRALDIGKCDVTDHGLKLLSENCPNLRKLSVKSCDMITDKGIQVIAYYCRGLQQLNIQDCQITVDGYRTVKKYCKRCIIEHTNPGFC